MVHTVRPGRLCLFGAVAVRPVNHRGIFHHLHRRFNLVVPRDNIASVDRTRLDFEANDLLAFSARLLIVEDFHVQVVVDDVLS